MTIDMVNVRSFSRHGADLMGCTTFSFTVEMGVFYRCLDVTVEKPDDSWCTFLITLGKPLSQPWFQPAGSAPPFDRPDVWFVLDDGSNVDECVTAARDLVVEQGLPMLNRFATPELAYHALPTETGTPSDNCRPGVQMPWPDSPAWRNAVLGIGHATGIENPRQDMWSAPILSTIRTSESVGDRP